MEPKSRKVMVVDDNQIDLYIAEMVMKTTKFADEVICMGSARQALDYLKPLHDRPEELPYLIFLDINMPEMTGFDFLNEYKSLPENIRKKCIIMMLTTSLRNVGVGLVIANGAFAGTPALTAVLAYGLLEVCGSLLVAFCARSTPRSNPAMAGV